MRGRDLDVLAVRAEDVARQVAEEASAAELVATENGLQFKVAC
jgi:hypothetical protein